MSKHSLLGAPMTLFACLRCFRLLPAWVVCLFAGRCPECGARAEEIAARPEEVLNGEY